MSRTRLLVILAACAAVVASGCLPRRGNPPLRPPAMVTRRDSVRASWRLVYAYTRGVGHYSQLPETLAPIIAASEAGPDLDVWGRRIRYRPDGRRFEVRSSGSDGVFDTNDDIVALGQLGRDQPCEIHDEFGVWIGEPPCAPTR
jgi:hypothetical protein